jgi:hypothetical protein
MQNQTRTIQLLYQAFTLKISGLLVEANPDSYARLLTRHRNVFSVGQCLSTKNKPEVVLFDAADLFGGILREGKENVNFLKCLTLIPAVKIFGNIKTLKGLKNAAQKGWEYSLND